MLFRSPDKAEQLRELAKDIVAEVKEAYSMTVTPVIGSHIGPGAFGFVVIKASQ